MRARLTLGTILTCFAWISSQAFAAPVNVDGDWIGGFETYDGPVFVTAHFDAHGDALSGLLGIPTRDDQRIELQHVSASNATLTFLVPGRNGGLRFEGSRRDRRVSGRVHQGGATRAFELIKIETISAETVKAISGDYVLAPGRVVLISNAAGSLIYLDQEANRLGMLYAIGGDTFVSGPSLVAGFPVELTLSFERGIDGAVSGMVWQPTGGKAQRAPKRAFYTAEEVGFENGDTHLAGTLLQPLTPGPHPAIVMLHGSGPATRESLQPFADVFARNGIAVLLHDKRGTGASTGNWMRATFEDLASDAIAAVQYLKTRHEINPRQIGLQGTSFGGWVAPLAASRSTDVAFVIVESAPAISPLEHERMRVRSQLRADGFPQEVIARALAFMDQKFDVARTGEGWPKLEEAMKRANDEGWSSYVNPPTSLDSLQWNWTNLLSYDPLPALEKLTCPVLVLYGQLDTIVSATKNRRRMEAALKRAGNRDATIKVFEKANHGFFAAITGGRREGPSLKGLVPGYLQARVDWLQKHLQTAGAEDVATVGAPTPLPSVMPTSLMPTSLMPTAAPAAPTPAAASILPRISTRS
jgi:pimeloyl-ACP methyl ester carboxylesterase